MKTKTLIFLAIATFLWACSKTEVVAPIPPVEQPKNQQVVITGSENPPEPVPISEVAPKDVHGADVSGKAQDMPEWSKEWEHTSDPIQAPAVGTVAPNPLWN